MKPLHLPLEGHDLLAVERFKDDTRHMAEFLILSTHCPLGRRGQYKRLFLTEDEYARMRSLERLSLIHISAGEVYALAILLAGAKYVTPEPYLKEDWAGVQVLLDRLVRGMSEETVSYTHLDVYKRQPLERLAGSMALPGLTQAPGCAGEPDFY